MSSPDRTEEDIYLVASLASNNPAQIAAEAIKPRAKALMSRDEAMAPVRPPTTIKRNITVAVLDILGFLGLFMAIIIALSKLEMSQKGL